MKEERYVIAQIAPYDPIGYCVNETETTEDIMQANMYDDVDAAIINFYQKKAASKSCKFKLFKITININELQVNINEIPEGPIPREPVQPQSRVLISPP